MGFRLALLILLSLLAQGCVKENPVVESREGCGSCHALHYAGAGACDDCHRGQPVAARKELAHARLLTGRAAEHVLAGGKAVTEGRALVEAAACRRCHTIAGEGNRLATNLDTVVWKREQRELTTSIMEPVENMPTFGFDRRQTEALIAYLLNSRQAGDSDETYRVQFVREVSRASSTFDEACGGCHRLLTALGPSGSGRRGPNLSGLFTAFYPKTAPDNQPWCESRLAEWVANPRAQRPATVMPPVPLSEPELQRVMESLRGSSAAGDAARARPSTR